jgi:hypothetical protein
MGAVEAIIAICSEKLTRLEAASRAGVQKVW